MERKLSEIIKELEDKGAIDGYFLHHEYYSGALELNIEFKNEIADDILDSSEIRVAESCAYWE